MDAGWDHSLFIQILAGLGLAAATGLRAFLPPVIVGLCARLDLISLRGDLDWLAGTPALIIFATAVAVEILADKVPLLDHGLDIVGLVVKPAAGALVLAAPLVDLGPVATVLMALAVGSTLAGTVHVTKSALRLASTGTTGGMGNPALSLAEDGLSLTGTLLAVVAPLLLLLLLALSLLFLRKIVHWMQARTQPRASTS